MFTHICLQKYLFSHYIICLEFNFKQHNTLVVVVWTFFLNDLHSSSLINNAVARTHMLYNAWACSKYSQFEFVLKFFEIIKQRTVFKILFSTKYYNQIKSLFKIQHDSTQTESFCIDIFTDLFLFLFFFYCLPCNRLLYQICRTCCAQLSAQLSNISKMSLSSLTYSIQHICHTHCCFQ